MLVFNTPDGTHELIKRYLTSISTVAIYFGDRNCEALSDEAVI